MLEHSSTLELPLSSDNHLHSKTFRIIPGTHSVTHAQALCSAALPGGGSPLFHSYLRDNIVLIICRRAPEARGPAAKRVKTAKFQLVHRNHLPNVLRVGEGNKGRHVFGCINWS